MAKSSKVCGIVKKSSSKDKNATLCKCTTSLTKELVKPTPLIECKPARNKCGQGHMRTQSKTERIRIPGYLLRARSVKMREDIFRKEMPFVLKAIYLGDIDFINKNSNLKKKSPVEVHYQKSGKDYKIEKFGRLSDYES